MVSLDAYNDKNSCHGGRLTPNRGKWIYGGGWSFDLERCRASEQKYIITLFAWKAPQLMECGYVARSMWTRELENNSEFKQDANRSGDRRRRKVTLWLCWSTLHLYRTWHWSRIRLILFKSCVLEPGAAASATSSATTGWSSASSEDSSRSYELDIEFGTVSWGVAVVLALPISARNKQKLSKNDEVTIKLSNASGTRSFLLRGNINTHKKEMHSANMTLSWNLNPNPAAVIKSYI